MAEKYMWPEEVYKKYGTLALSYIQDNIYLVDTNDFNKLYSQIGDMGIVANVTAILRDSDIDPLVHLNHIPNCFMQWEHEVTEFVIPRNIRAIGDKAFASCDSLQTLVIPDSITYIGNRPFYGTDRLSYLTYQGTKDQWEAIEKHPTWNQSYFVTKVRCIDGEVLYND